MRFVDDVVLRKTNNDLIMIYHKVNGTLFELNETSSYIVDLIMNNTKSKEDLLIRALSEFQCEDSSSVEKDINDVIQELTDYGVIEDE